jgi:hypothetical protein
MIRNLHGDSALICAGVPNARMNMVRNPCGKKIIDAIWCAQCLVRTILVRINPVFVLYLSFLFICSAWHGTCSVHNVILMFVE